MQLRWWIWLAPLGAAACSWSQTSERRAAVTAPTPTFMHAGFTAGPALYTDDGGHLIEERRSEPFGQPIEHPDVIARDLNQLNKRTDPATGWSDHGARWMTPAAARWLTPDPPIEGPAATAMVAPWALHPYQYVGQNPVVFWDPDGRQPALTDDQIRAGITAKVKDPWARSVALDLLRPPSPAQATAFRNTASHIATGDLKVAFKMDIRGPVAHTQWSDDAHEWLEPSYWSHGINPDTGRTFMYATDANVVQNGGTAFIDESMSRDDQGRPSLNRDDMALGLVRADHMRLLDTGTPEDQLPLLYRFKRDSDAIWTARGGRTDPLSLMLDTASSEAEYMSPPDAYASWALDKVDYAPGALPHHDNEEELMKP